MPTCELVVPVVVPVVPSVDPVAPSGEPVVPSAGPGVSVAGVDSCEMVGLGSVGTSGRAVVVVTCGARPHEIAERNALHERLDALRPGSYQDEQRRGRQRREMNTHRATSVVFSEYNCVPRDSLARP